jgi:hypothetical protein
MGSTLRSAATRNSDDDHGFGQVERQCMKTSDDFDFSFRRSIKARTLPDPAPLGESLVREASPSQ